MIAKYEAAKFEIQRYPICDGGVPSLPEAQQMIQEIYDKMKQGHKTVIQYVPKMRRLFKP